MDYDLRQKRSLNWAAAVLETVWRGLGRKGVANADGQIQRNWIVSAVAVGEWEEEGPGRARATRLDLGQRWPLAQVQNWGRGPDERRGLPHPAWGLFPPPLYSFVIGSDGYVYEGRGWHWVGAHTLGHNSLGFGVAFVGNYTAELPAKAALHTVQDVLPGCAVRAGLLRPDYALLGHRQLVSTDCPGDALFNLLRTWPRFAAVSTRPLTTSTCGASFRTSSERGLTPYCSPYAHTASARLLVPLAVHPFRQPRLRFHLFYLEQAPLRCPPVQRQLSPDPASLSFTQAQHLCPPPKKQGL